MTIEVRFPEGLSRGARAGPAFNTSVAVASSGYSQRVAMQEVPLWRFDCSHLLKTEAQYQELHAFFLAVLGAAESFRFKNWHDYQATAQAIGTGDGSDLTFQLVKVYTSSAGNTTRTVKKPVSGTVSVYVAGVLKVEGANPGGDYQIDYTSGIVTFNAGKAPAGGAAVTATFEFDYEVRLEDDEMMAAIVAYGVYEWPDIVLVEERA